MILLILNLVAASLLGAMVIIVCAARLKIGEFVSLAFGVGSAVFTASVFVAMAAFSAPFTARTVVIVIGVLSLVLLPLAVWRIARSGRWPLAEGHGEREHLSRMGILMAAAVIGLVAYVILLTLYWPQWYWDALAVWLVKARGIYISQSLQGYKIGAGPAYPLHLPLQLAILRLTSPEPLTLLALPLYLVALLVVVKDNLSRLGLPNHALLFTMLVATMPILLQYASVAHAEMPYTFYYVASVLYLVSFIYTKQTALALLSGLLVGICVWTRPEGPLSFAINYSALLVFLARMRTRSALIAAVAYPLAAASLGSPWQIYTRVLHLQGGDFVTSAGVAVVRELAQARFSFGKLFEILQYFLDQWTTFGNWGAVWPLFVLSLLNWRGARQHAYLLAIILLNIGALLFTYYAVPDSPSQPLSWWLWTGFPRMVLHFAPLLWAYIGLAWRGELSQASAWYFSRLRVGFRRAGSAGMNWQRP